MSIVDYFVRRAQLREIKNNPNLITDIENPTERMQLEAVRRNPELISVLDKPTERVKMEAVRQNPDLLLQMNAPSEQVCLTAMVSKPELIEHIEKQTERMQLYAVRRHPDLITLMENPCEKAQFMAVMTDPRLIAGIENPTANVQLSAVRKDPMLLCEIDNPDWRTQLYAIRKDTMMIHFIKNPVESVQATVVKENPALIAFIKNPTEKVQLMSVKADASNILKIENPSRRVCLMALGSIEHGVAVPQGDISSSVKTLFAKLEKIKERHMDMMTEPGNAMAIKENAEKYRKAETTKAIRSFEKELSDVPAPAQKVSSEAVVDVTAQSSGEEMRFKGGRKEITIKNGTATIRTNGENFDATNVLKDMQKNGVNVKEVTPEAWGKLLQGSKVSLPGAKPGTGFALLKGPAGFGLQAFQIAKQVHQAAAQEM